MSEQEHEAENGEESSDEEGPPGTTGEGWEETSDEPAQGEGGQDAV